MPRRNPLKKLGIKKRDAEKYVNILTIVQEKIEKFRSELEELQKKFFEENGFKIFEIDHLIFSLVLESDRVSEKRAKILALISKG